MARIKKYTLTSGIKMLAEQMPDVESTSVGLWVNTGSRDETAAENGVSHFIEHLLFKGTKKRSAKDISREIESVGGVLNAFTGREYTCFYAKVLNKDLGLAVDLLSDIFQNSVFDQTELEKERLVVLQEIKMVEDTPDDLVHDLYSERFWKDHALGRPILGTSKTIASLKRDGIKGYFDSRYHAGSVFVTIAGNFNFEKAKRLLEKSFKNVRAGAAPKAKTAPASAKGAVLVKKKLEQVHLCLGAPSVAQAHKDRYGAYILNTILGGGMSSRLFQRIREERGLAYSVYSYLNLCADAGSLVAYAGTSKHSFTEVVSLILKEFAKLKKNGVSRDELDCAKEQLKGGMLLGLETSDSRMTKLARDEIYFKRHVPIKEIVAGVDSVRPLDIKRLANEFLRSSSLMLVAIGDVGNKDIPPGISKV